ncbi:MAG: ABC transporter permease subunit [Eubacteriales bacterium]
MKKINKNYLALAPFLLAVIAYELLPLMELFINSIKVDGELGLGNYIRIATTPLYQMSVWNSVRISLIASCIGIIIAFFVAKAYYEVGGNWRRIMTMILNMTSNFTGLPLTFAFMILMGNTGVLTLLGQQYGIPFLKDFDLYTGNGLTIIFVYFQVPLATLLLMPTFLTLKKEWKEAAALMQASGISYWWHVAIPNLLPGILGTVSVLFANSLAAYATAYALVQNNYALLALQISSKFKGDVSIDKELGGALAMVLILLMVLATLFNNQMTKKYAKGRELI